ncbi:hypothetical protein BDQ17DRAFT_1331958 [Cyathus striatus]|nr:hypothetical protein BDQ17DRAFT_1331958 [Cyathus striatus]
MDITDPQYVSQALQYKTNVGYSYAICVASLTYDIILYLPDEIEYIWMIGNGLVQHTKVFIFNITIPRGAVCIPIAHIRMLLTNCQSVLGWYQGYALYGHSRLVIVFLFVLWIDWFGVLTYYCIKITPHISAVPLVAA